ncbi:SDR family oxidoreductase [Nocardioides sp. HDW12B]|uniref:SDR family oxidoreductase n=1 Tax=Nocardioides sp. HDW12B TaxID=2714939 RepID=UPI001408C009|nr:SDR family oxidoreductase [Nocardioides sp. HDW12B]QIK67370.1 SDR family oxidoreductase [Nocardioides sp. HDW12B]
MSQIVVTGATGHLGHLVVEHLLDRRVPAETITATGRSLDKVADLAERGVRTAAVDFEDPATIAPALGSGDVLVLVSSSAVGRRTPQHRNVVDAAVQAGVARVVYTSIPKADSTPMLLAQEHRETEELLAASGLPVTLLRNAWYVENYSAQAPTYLEHGMVGAAGDGLVSIAPRSEYAEAAAVVASADGHEGKVYELGGEAVTMSELASLFSDALGQQITYTDVDEATLRGILEGAGLGPAAAVFADVDSRVRAGDLHVTSGHLGELLGRTPTSAKQAVLDAVR